MTHRPRPRQAMFRGEGVERDPAAPRPAGLHLRLRSPLACGSTDLRYADRGRTRVHARPAAVSSAEGNGRVPMRLSAPNAREREGSTRERGPRVVGRVAGRQDGASHRGEQNPLANAPQPGPATLMCPEPSTPTANGAPRPPGGAARTGLDARRAAPSPPACISAWLAAAAPTPGRGPAAACGI